MSIRFPEPLPEFSIDTEIDETGFTVSEKVALQNAWRVIKRHFRRHAYETFLNFFTNHEYLIERFRGADGKFQLEALNRHPLSVMYTFEQLITHGLESPQKINFILTDSIGNHKRRGVTSEEIELLASDFKNYLLDVLRPISSLTLVVAMEKIVHLMKAYFDEENTD